MLFERRHFTQPPSLATTLMVVRNGNLIEVVVKVNLIVRAYYNLDGPADIKVSKLDAKLLSHQPVRHFQKPMSLTNLRIQNCSEVDWIRYGTMAGLRLFLPALDE